MKQISLVLSPKLNRPQLVIIAAWLRDCADKLENDNSYSQVQNLDYQFVEDIKDTDPVGHRITQNNEKTGVVTETIRRGT